MEELHGTSKESEQLERLQLARITCGLRKGTSHQEIYRETKWKKVRRQEEAAVLSHHI